MFLSESIVSNIYKEKTKNCRCKQKNNDILKCCPFLPLYFAVRERVSIIIIFYLSHVLIYAIFAAVKLC